MNFLLDGLACYRLTRLIRTDGITRRPRGVILTWAERSDKGVMAHPMVVEWFDCPWCVSMYAAVGIVAARKVAPRAWGMVGMALALSAVAGGISVVLPSNDAA
jgi:hypothetical protein